MRVINNGPNDKLFLIDNLPFRKGLYEVYYNTESNGKTTVGLRNIHNQQALSSPILPSQYTVNGSTFSDNQIIELVTNLSVALGFNTEVFYNEAGQVKVNFTGLTLTNFTADTIKTFDINSGVPTIVSSPTTTFPHSTIHSYSGVFDSTRGSSPTGRLIENPINGQKHVWRVQGSYSNKATGNNGALDLVLKNPVSGFSVTKSITLPSGRTSGLFDELIITIADQASIPSPNGYILQSSTSFSDANLSISITSITRFSDAKDI